MIKTYRAVLRIVDGHQEVVLPPEIHLEDDEYFIRRDSESGDLILERIPHASTHSGDCEDRGDDPR